MDIETQWHKTPDGLALFARRWHPTGGARAVAIVLHGYGEHSGRYEHIISPLVADGYIVHAPDQRGHGRSDGTRGHFRMAELVDDFGRYVASVRQQHPEAPVTLIAHSLGSLVALSHVLRHPQTIDRLVLSGTATAMTENAPPLLRRIATALSYMLPLLFIRSIPPAEGISNDPQAVAAFENDPLVLGQGYRLGALRDMLKTAEDLSARVQQLTLPLLLLHGGDDPLTPVSGARWVHDSAQSDDKQLKIYPGMKHEVFNEIEREQVLADLRAWLSTH